MHTNTVRPHPYTARVVRRGKHPRWPSLQGEIYERDVKIGTFSRATVVDGYISDIEVRFLSTQARARFDDFSDCLSIPETIEALIG